MMNCRGFWGCKKINAVSGIYNCGQTHRSEKNSSIISNREMRGLIKKSERRGTDILVK